MKKQDLPVSSASLIRGIPAVTDLTLAATLGLAAAHLRALVERHAARFPADFAFPLTAAEGGRFKSAADERPTLAFTEAGVTMMLALVRTPLAAEVSVALLRRLGAFRRFAAANADFFAPLAEMQLALEGLSPAGAACAALFGTFAPAVPLNGLFLKGALYPPRAALELLFARAKKSIEIRDDGLPPIVLELLGRKRPNVAVRLVTAPKNAIASRRLAVFDRQHSPVTIAYQKEIPCRVIILDETQVFRLGRSLRDLGKQPFALLRGTKFDILST